MLGRRTTPLYACEVLHELPGRVRIGCRAIRFLADQVDDLQEKILGILGIDQERADRMFGFLLRALEYGAPPHAGIAPGLDRLVSLMVGTDSIRDVIAFPKTTNGASLMDGAPTPIEPEQLEELGLIIKQEEKT